MPSCSVKWCSNHTSSCSLKSKNGVSFHRFPKDEDICQKWVEAVRHERRDPWWTSSNASRICSIHFKETDITSTPCKVNILAKSAVPVCTMVWYDENENNTTTTTSNERTRIDKPILKTYERKKSNINVLKELKVNRSYNWNNEGTAMSKTNSVVISNKHTDKQSYLSQDYLSRATKLFKTLDVSKPLNSKEWQVTNIIANVTDTQKNTVPIESNKKEYVKSCKDKCCKSKILVKLNDNTSLILDEDWSNNGTKFRDSNKMSKKPNSRTCENLRNVIVEFKSNENKELNKVNNIPKSDMFVETITNRNVQLHENISKSYVGKMLKTYLPKRKDKISEKNIRATSEHLEKNKSLCSITTEKGLNNVKCKEVKNTNVNKHSKDDFSNKLKINVCYKNNIITSNTNPKKKQRALLNVKKYTFKRRSNLFNRPRIREQKKVAVEQNIDVNKKSSIARINEFIMNQSRIGNIKETAVYDEIISELFETSKYVGNVSIIPSNDNYQVSNENVCTENNMDSALDKGTNNGNVILDLNTKNYTALTTLMDLELYRVVNTGLYDENRGEKQKSDTNKTTVNENITQFNENTISESDQQMSIYNTNMNYNVNIHNNNILLPNNELVNLESTIVRNLVPETKKEKFIELKKNLSMKPKLDSSFKLSTNVLTHIDKNIFSRYDNVSPTPMPKENLQVSNRNCNSEFNKNISIDVNDMATSIQSNINFNTTQETESNIKLNPILINEFINNIFPDSNNSQNVDFITNIKTDQNTIRKPECKEKNCCNVESKKIVGKDMPDLDAAMNLEPCREVSIGLNSGIDAELNTDITENADFSHYNENTAKESNQKLSVMNKNMTAEQSNHLIPISIQCNKSLEKDMPELNPVILSELNEDQLSESNQVINRKLNHLNTEMYTDKELLLRKSRKDFVTVLATSDDQHTVVNEHMDVVDSILNRDIAAEFDLSLLLSDTPIPDEEIPNLDNNSNSNSLDGIVGSPNWILIPTGEMPKIIDDILDQGSPFFENLDLYEKDNKFNIEKESNRKDNEIKNLIKEKYSTSNLEQFNKQIINNNCDNGKQWTNNSIAQIEKQLIAEISDFNETSSKQSNNICKENKISQSKEVTAEKGYNLCDEQTDKQILEQYLQSNNKQCEQFNLDQIVDKRYENRDTIIQIGINTINQCQLENNIDSKANQIGDPSINQYFEQSEKLQQNGLGSDNSSDEGFTEVDIFEKSQKQSDKQSNEQTYQLGVGKNVTTEESTPKSTTNNQGTVESNVQEINRQLFKECNKKRMEVNNVSNEAHTADIESVRELNIGQLKKAIFEECYDPECRNDCKNQNHNLDTKSNKKDDEKRTINTPCPPDIEKRMSRYDLIYKRQCYQTSIDNSKEQLQNSSFDTNTKEIKKKSFLERHESSGNEKYKTKYKKIAIDHIPGQYLELKWKEGEGKSNTLSQEGCKRKHKELALDHRKMLCSESSNIFSQQIMAECPECGYTTDDNDFMNYKSDVDLTITKPLSLINKDKLLSSDIENENNNQNNGNYNKVALESVYAMELAYVTAIQALERKLKQKIAVSEYRLRRVNNLSKINNQLSYANITLMDLFRRNKV